MPPEASENHGDKIASVDDLGLFAFPQVAELTGGSLLACALGKIILGREWLWVYSGLTS
jgi:hypothetical protein